MGNHVGPGPVDTRSSFPSANILLEDGLPGKDDIGHVDHLLVGDGRASMCRQSREIFNGIEDDVDWQRDVEVEVGDL